MIEYSEDLGNIEFWIKKDSGLMRTDAVCEALKLSEHALLSAAEEAGIVPTVMMSIGTKNGEKHAHLIWSKTELEELKKYLDSE